MNEVTGKKKPPTMSLFICKLVNSFQNSFWDITVYDPHGYTK
jgi:hypothetical protein